MGPIISFQVGVGEGLRGQIFIYSIPPPPTQDFIFAGMWTPFLHLKIFVCLHWNKMLSKYGPHQSMLDIPWRLSPFKHHCLSLWVWTGKDCAGCLLIGIVLCVSGFQQEGSGDQEDGQSFCLGYGRATPVSWHSRGQGVRNYQVRKLMIIKLSIMDHVCPLSFRS